MNGVAALVDETASICSKLECLVHCQNKAPCSWIPMMHTSICDGWIQSRHIASLKVCVWGTPSVGWDIFLHLLCMPTSKNLDNYSLTVVASRMNPVVRADLKLFVKYHITEFSSLNNWHDRDLESQGEFCVRTMRPSSFDPAAFFQKDAAWDLGNIRPRFTEEGKFMLWSPR